SVMYGRMNTTNLAVKMPPLARNVIDTNAVQVLGDWINSLPGTAALAPPTILPNGGAFNGGLRVTLQHADATAVLRYTTDGSLPTTSSAVFADSVLVTNNVTLRAIASDTGYNTSVASTALFIINQSQFNSVILTNGTVHLFFLGNSGQTYILQGSTNLLSWDAIATNVAPASVFELVDPQAGQFQSRYYRTVLP
ncbi:MAG TPA: chitobiase/beta-hexosaminidase C-terminal domain-containing protein, partial [Verrucomicrobiae bacterium]